MKTLTKEELDKMLGLIPTQFCDNVKLAELWLPVIVKYA